MVDILEDESASSSPLIYTCMYLWHVYMYDIYAYDHGRHISRRNCVRFIFYVSTSHLCTWRIYDIYVCCCGWQIRRRKHVKITAKISGLYLCTYIYIYDIFVDYDGCPILRQKCVIFTSHISRSYFYKGHIYIDDVNICYYAWHMRGRKRGGGLGSRPIFKKFHETYAPS